MLQSGKKVGSILDEVILFFKLPNLSSRIIALGLTQSLTEVPGNFLGHKDLTARKEDNLTAICEPIV
jgi:hypothetical protein